MVKLSCDSCVITLGTGSDEICGTNVIGTGTGTGIGIIIGAGTGAGAGTGRVVWIGFFCLDRKWIQVSGWPRVVHLL